MSDKLTKDTEKIVSERPTPTLMPPMERRKS